MVVGMSGNEKQPDLVLKEILSSSRRKWQELIDDLLSDQLRLKISPPNPQDHSTDRSEDVNTSTSQESIQPQAGVEKLTSAAAGNPLDTETIFARDERLHRLTQVMARLNKVEKQNHKIMALIFALTFWTFIFIVMAADLFPQTNLFQLP
jgi:hypothetical protein